MLEQKYRFHGHGSLRYVYRNGKGVRTYSLSLRFAANPKRADNRYTIVIARKVLKSAPKRNRVRRRLYEIVRLNQHHLKPVHDLVITVHDPRLVDAAHRDVEAQLIGLFKKAQLWRSSHSQFSAGEAEDSRFSAKIESINSQT